MKTWTARSRYNLSPKGVTFKSDHSKNPFLSVLTQTKIISTIQTEKHRRFLYRAFIILFKSAQTWALNQAFLKTCYPSTQRLCNPMSNDRLKNATSSCFKVMNSWGTRANKSQMIGRIIARLSLVSCYMQVHLTPEVMRLRKPRLLANYKTWWLNSSKGWRSSRLNICYQRNVSKLFKTCCIQDYQTSSGGWQDCNQSLARCVVKNIPGW
jgi:hypothetical protein